MHLLWGLQTVDTKRTAHLTIWVTRVGAHSALLRDPLATGCLWSPPCPEAPVCLDCPHSGHAALPSSQAGHRRGARPGAQSHHCAPDAWPPCITGTFCGALPPRASGRMTTPVLWSALGLLVAGASDLLLMGQGRVCTSTSTVPGTSGEVAGTAA